ncbi:MAG: DJ-1/PfpI family protein [Anaerolineaceae bacterium]|nr:DJ-1/PfpI family protein [Anaerolineaceae bacterium]
MALLKRRAKKEGHETVIASIVKGICPGSRGGFATTTLTLNEVQTGDYDAVVFVGGGGSKMYFANEGILLIAREMYKRETVVAAICLAPVILANAGILKGKNATVAGTEARTMENKGQDIQGLGLL